MFSSRPTLQKNNANTMLCNNNEINCIQL